MQSYFAFELIYHFIQILLFIRVMVNGSFCFFNKQTNRKNHKNKDVWLATWLKISILCSCNGSPAGYSAIVL